MKKYDIRVPVGLEIRAESVRRNVQWHEDHFDPDLLAAVRRALAPVMNKQWDYDDAVDRLKMKALEGAPK